MNKWQNAAQHERDWDSRLLADAAPQAFLPCSFYVLAQLMPRCPRLWLYAANALRCLTQLPSAASWALVQVISRDCTFCYVARSML